MFGHFFLNCRPILDESAFSGRSKITLFEMLLDLVKCIIDKIFYDDFYRKNDRRPTNPV